MSLFIGPEAWPFTVAVMLVLAFAVIEGMALLIGTSVSGWLDHFAHDITPEGATDSWLGWLHIGKVPTMVILVTLLTSFAIGGYIVNALVHGILGVYPSPLLSAPIAFFGALPVVRTLSTALARIIPRDETFAVPFESLVGRVAVILTGTAKADYPAEARVKNEHGLTLYVRVEPDIEAQQLMPGESVLLVKHVAGSRFKAITNPRPDIL